MLGHNPTDNVKQLAGTGSRALILATAYSATRTKAGSSPMPFYPIHNSQHTRPIPKGHPRRKLKVPTPAEMPQSYN